MDKKMKLGIGIVSVGIVALTAILGVKIWHKEQPVQKPEKQQSEIVSQEKVEKMEQKKEEIKIFKRRRSSDRFHDR